MGMGFPGPGNLQSHFFIPTSFPKHLVSYTLSFCIQRLMRKD